MKQIGIRLSTIAGKLTFHPRYYSNLKSIGLEETQMNTLMDSVNYIQMDSEGKSLFNIIEHRKYINRR